MPYLYAVQMTIPEYFSPIKIGYSIRPTERSSEMTKGPFPRRLLGFWPATGPEDERLAHLLLDNFRLSGEWFFPSRAVIDFVQARIERHNGRVGEPVAYVDPIAEAKNAWRWNLARMAADEGPHPWGRWTDEADFLSSTFDRSEVSHEALKSNWRM